MRGFVMTVAVCALATFSLATHAKALNKNDRFVCSCGSEISAGAQNPRPRSILPQRIPRVAQRAIIQRQAATTDAVVQAIPQCLQRPDARIQVLAPGR